MKGRHITILLVIIAINLTVIALDRVVDRFIPDAMAASSIQKLRYVMSGTQLGVHVCNTTGWKM